MHKDEQKAQEKLERNVRYMTSVLKASDTERKLRQQVKLKLRGGCPHLHQNNLAKKPALYTFLGVAISQQDVNIIIIIITMCACSKMENEKTNRNG